MREIRLSGSVEGVVSNHDPYSDFHVVSEATQLGIQVRTWILRWVVSRRADLRPRIPRHESGSVVQQQLPARESRHQQRLCDGIVMVPTPLSPELNLDAVDHRDPCYEEVPPGLGRRRR